MASMGSAGVEEVTKHVNGYFGQLIDRVTKHGGDVLKFAVRSLVFLPFDSMQREMLCYVCSGDLTPKRS
jgi:hypothetical protein